MDEVRITIDDAGIAAALATGPAGFRPPPSGRRGRLMASAYKHTSVPCGTPCGLSGAGPVRGTVAAMPLRRGRPDPRPVARA